MKRKLRFYKESNGDWFVDLPEWEGDKADLQMVMGADTMLDIMAQGDGELNMLISSEPFTNCNVLVWFANGIAGDRSHGGAQYRLHQYSGIPYDLDIWLCDVTKFVYGGDMPQLIYFIRTV